MDDKMENMLIEVEIKVENCTNDTLPNVPETAASELSASEALSLGQTSKTLDINCAELSLQATSRPDIAHCEINIVPENSSATDSLANAANETDKGITDTVSIKEEIIEESQVECSEHGQNITNVGEYRKPASEDVMDASNSSSDESDEQISIIAEKNVLMNLINHADDASDEDSDGGDHRKTGSKGEPFVPKTKGELLLQDLPQLEDLKITVADDVKLEMVGHISSVIGVLVVVKGLPNSKPLNMDTILFVEGRKAIGQVFETLGPVLAPFYSMRFNSTDEILQKGISVGQTVYYAPDIAEYTHYVFMEQLRNTKGSDASWEHNNEPPDKFLEYSDDEQERRAKAKIRNKDGNDKNEDTEKDLSRQGQVSTGEHHNKKKQRKNKKAEKNQCWPPKQGAPSRWRQPEASRMAENSSRGFQPQNSGPANPFGTIRQQVPPPAPWTNDGQPRFPPFRAPFDFNQSRNLFSQPPPRPGYNSNEFRFGQPPNWLSPVGARNPALEGRNPRGFCPPQFPSGHFSTPPPPTFMIDTMECGQRFPIFGSPSSGLTFDPNRPPPPLLFPIPSGPRLAHSSGQLAQSLPPEAATTAQKQSKLVDLRFVQKQRDANTER